MEHRVDVAETLRQLEPFPYQWIIETENLHHAARPANTLTNVRRERFRRQTGGLRNTHIGRGITPTVQTQRGVRIFSHRFDGNTANFIQRFTADNRTGAAEERGVPHVVTILHQTIEQRAFVRGLTETAKVAFKRVRREEVVRRLHHRQLFLFQEPAHGHLQERSRRYVVAVKDRDKLPGGILQRVIDVTGFSMFVRRTGDVFDADLFRELAERWAVAVIQDPDLEFIFRPVDAERSINGVFHHAQVFVVGWDEEIDSRPRRGVLRQRYGLAIERPDDLEIPQHQHNPGIGFGKQQNQTADQTHRVVPVQR